MIIVAPAIIHVPGQVLEALKDLVPEIMLVTGSILGKDQNLVLELTVAPELILEKEKGLVVEIILVMGPVLEKDQNLVQDLTLVMELIPEKVVALVKEIILVPERVLVKDLIHAPANIHAQTNLVVIATNVAMGLTHVN